jgi:DNA-binding NarL/FixJ family response regulator
MRADVSNVSHQNAEILIVDDHEMIRSGIRSLLSMRPEWHVCGEAVDGVDAIEKAKSLKPDVVLMDVSMPRMDGLSAMSLVRKELPDSNIILVTQNDAASIGLKSARADGYVLKLHLHRDLIPTIERVLQHGHNGKAGTTD